MADAQVGIGAALIDAPEHLLRIDRVLQLIQAGIFRLAAHEPAVSPANGFLHIFVRRGILNTFVEGHADIRAEIRLNLHTFLRPHKDLMPVDVRGEIDALLLDLPQAGERKDLEAAGIGQNRFIPCHELVQAAHIVDKAITWTQMQMVGI